MVACRLEPGDIVGCAQKNNRKRTDRFAYLERTRREAHFPPGKVIKQHFAFPRDRHANEHDLWAFGTCRTLSLSVKLSEECGAETTPDLASGRRQRLR